MKLNAHSFSACGLFPRIAVLGAIAVGCSLVSVASAQTETDLNPIYKNNKSLEYLEKLLNIQPDSINAKALKKLILNIAMKLNWSALFFLIYPILIKLICLQLLMVIKNV